MPALIKQELYKKNIFVLNHDTIINFFVNWK